MTVCETHLHKRTLISLWFDITQHSWSSDETLPHLLKIQLIFTKGNDILRRGFITIFERRLLESVFQSHFKWWWEGTDFDTPETSTRSCAASKSTTQWRSVGLFPSDKFEKIHFNWLIERFILRPQTRSLQAWKTRSCCAPRLLSMKLESKCASDGRVCHALGVFMIPVKGRIPLPVPLAVSAVRSCCRFPDVRGLVFPVESREAKLWVMSDTRRSL